MIFESEVKTDFRMKKKSDLLFFRGQETFSSSSTNLLKSRNKSTEEKKLTETLTRQDERYRHQRRRQRRRRQRRRRRRRRRRLTSGFRDLSAGHSNSKSNLTYKKIWDGRIFFQRRGSEFRLIKVLMMSVETKTRFFQDLLKVKY